MILLKSESLAFDNAGLNLPTRAVKILKESKKYPEGNAIYIDVKGTRDVPFITKLRSRWQTDFEKQLRRAEARLT